MSPLLKSDKYDYWEAHFLLIFNNAKNSVPIPSNWQNLIDLRAYELWSAINYLLSTPNRQACIDDVDFIPFTETDFSVMALIVNSWSDDIGYRCTIADRKITLIQI
jgi:hypothetical protein